MAKIFVFLNGTLVIEKPLDPGTEYVLGRGSQCQICLDHAEVSRQHAKISHDGQVWSIKVLSRYGRVVVNGAPVDDLSLSHGSLFSIPPFEFRFEDQSQDIQLHAEVDQPVVAMPEQLSDKTSVGLLTYKPVLMRLNSSGEPVEELELSLTGTIEAGRSRSCQIKLTDEKASRKHFTLQYDGKEFVITDLGSPNGTRVNGQTITTSSLKSGDEILVGNETMRFELLNPEFENLPVSAPDFSGVLPPAIGEATEPAVIKIAPQFSPAVWKSSHIENFTGHVNAQVGRLRKRNIGPAAKVMLLVFVGGLIYLIAKPSDDSKKANRNPAGLNAGAGPKAEVASLEKLTSEQRHFIDETYNLSMNLYTNGKYDQAALEVAKILQILPNHKDAKDLQGFCQRALEKQRSLDEIARKKKEQEELQQKVAAILDDCEKLVTAHKYGEVETCVLKISDLDPDNARGQNLVMTAKQALDQQQLSQEERANRARKKAQAQRAFENGKNAYNQKRFPAAISAFTQAASLAFDDSENMKAKAKLGIKSAREKMTEQSNVLMREGRTALEVKDYKNAITKLRMALELYPDNGDARIYKERAENEAHAELKNLYAESVIEENIGNVESAKKKWRTIIDAGIKSDQYYEKAKLKLGKYEK